MNEKYVLITPARNEDKFIERTIQSVFAQTVLPQKWVIVSDGSTDRTDDIVSKNAVENSIIKFVRTDDQPGRNFGSKVAAFNLGCEQLNGVEYDFIGNLDADISFEPNYYYEVFNRFESNQKLGLAGGVRLDVVGGSLREIKSARNSVAGGFQLFRRKCFEDIDGYKILKYGGIDAVAEISARMHGWEVESFPDIVAHHHRPTGTAVNNILKQKFRAGAKYYFIGYHPVFPLLRFGSRIFQKPIIIGSLISIFGFFWASLRRYKRPVSDAFVKYLRSEQSGRLKLLISRRKDKALRI